MPRNTHTNLQGYIPCIYHIAAKRKSDTEVLERLIPLAKYLEINNNDLSLITISMDHSNNLDRWYRSDEFSEIVIDVPFSCSDMIEYIGDDILCNVCEYSYNYRNYNFQLEKNLLSYCFRSVTNREKVERLMIGHTSDELFRSYVRLGHEYISLTYVNLNKFIFEYLQNCVAAFDNLNSEDNFQAFYLSLIPPEKNLSCYEMNRDFIYKYYMNLFKNKDREVVNDSNIGNVVALLLSVSPLSQAADVPNDLSVPLCSPGDSQLKVAAQPCVELDIKNAPGCQEDSVDNELNAIDTTDLDKGSLPEEQAEACKDERISVFVEQYKEAQQTSLKYPELYEIDISRHKNIRQIINEADATMMDYDILKNNFMCIELVKTPACEGLLIYLPKGNVCYFVTLDNKLCNDIIAYYCCDERVLKKLCIHSISIIDYFNRYGYSIRNLISIQTMYNISSLDSLTVTCDRDLIEKTSENKIGGKGPFIALALKKYLQIYEKINGVMTCEQKKSLMNECYYERMIGVSYNLKDLSTDALSCPHYVSFDNLHDYRFAYQSNTVCDEEGVKICVNYMHPEASTSALKVAYKWICITCVETGIFEKHAIKLLRIDTDYGLVFHSPLYSYRVFFSLLNRWMISAGKLYISLRPLINVKAEPIEIVNQSTQI